MILFYIITISFSVLSFIAILFLVKDKELVSKIQKNELTDDSLPSEILKKVKAIEIKTRKEVNDILSGDYHSAFKGQGMEFAEVRKYLPGDDYRSIDWNVTARMREPHIKKFVEEREQTLFFLVDASGSGETGTKGMLKGEMAVELTALLAFAAIKNNDRVGLIIFTDIVEKYIPPKKGKNHVLRVIREILYHQPQNKKTNIEVALSFLSRLKIKKSTVFIISDFINSGYEQALKIVSKKHDMVAVALNDTIDTKLPDVGLIELEDAETGEEILIDSSSEFYREEYTKTMELKKTERDSLFRKSSVDLIDLYTGVDYTKSLRNFFGKRKKANNR